MSWSWKIARVAGIPIYVHWTFLILLAWLVFGHWAEGHDLKTTAEGVGFILAIFGCVVLHELGHALAAKHYGVTTTDITLLPIGGVARLQRIPDKPSQELVVAIAGPLVNVAIAGLLIAAGVNLNIDPSDPQFLVNARFLPKLLFVNIMLVLFNLLPAFPMDGGRILRALLALVMPYGQATRIAATIGQFMAILFVFAGLSGNPMLILVGLFVWIGAEGEALMVQERILLKDIPVREAMLTSYETLDPSDTLGHAADLLLAGSQQDFPVLDGHEPGRVLTRAGLMAGLSRGGRDARVADAPLDELGTIEASTPLAPAVARLREGNSPCLQVVDQGRPVGLLTLENVGELLMVRSALAEATGQDAATLTATPPRR